MGTAIGFPLALKAAPAPASCLPSRAFCRTAATYRSSRPMFACQSGELRWPAVQHMQGEVIGINSQIYSRSGGYQGLSIFAIPIEVAINVEKQIVAHGKVQRAEPPISRSGSQSILADRGSVWPLNYFRRAPWLLASKKAARPPGWTGTGRCDSAASTAKPSRIPVNCPPPSPANFPGRSGTSSRLARGQTR